MGMDVYGNNPDSKTGEYFRNNVWWWRPLADYLLNHHPDLTAPCTYWHSNDGDGLNADQSLALAEALKADLKAGIVQAYSRNRARIIKTLPNEPCWLCNGTGKRKPATQIGPGTEPCNGCNSTGQILNQSTQYPFSTQNVRNFVRFLEHCGGFRIC